jgi:hypothetical protein
MTRSDKKMVEKNLDLIFEFEKYVLQHPDIAGEIPQDAVVFMQVEGDEKFNRWSQRLAEKHREQGQPIFCITIKKMKPVHSRIEELSLERTA